MALKEKDIVKHITENWDKYFPDIRFWRTEYSFRDFRVDIAADFKVNLKDLGIREEDCWCRPPIFFEVKYKSEMRDLLFELQKQIAFRDWYTNIAKCFCMICVISDRYDEHMVKFMRDHNVHMYLIEMEDEDLDTLTLTEYNPILCDDIDIKDIYLEGDKQCQMN